MNRPIPPLEDLRRAIDAVDDGLLDLVVRRSEIVAQVGRGKSGTGAPIYRPAREAQIMRRLLSRLSDSDEKERVVRIWRAIMAASYERQGGLRLVADPLAEWAATVHFSPRHRPAVAGARAAVEKVLAGGADLAVVPAPTPFGAGDWIGPLIEARRGGEAAFVLARLPFFAVPAGGPVEALVVGRGIADPSGDDVALVAAPAEAAPVGGINVCFETGAKGLSLFAFAEYVRPDDPRLAAGTVWLGAYPRPLDPSGPRAVEFTLRP
ncbi:MAG: chorismate mutase [Rhodospirillaceae bacterium]|nr:chorismate mutase [Rhodospirillaceae bacterium]